MNDHRPRRLSSAILQSIHAALGRLFHSQEQQQERGSRDTDGEETREPVSPLQTKDTLRHSCSLHGSLSYHHLQHRGPSSNRTINRGTYFALILGWMDGWREGMAIDRGLLGKRDSHGQFPVLLPLPQWVSSCHPFNRFF